VKIESFEQLKDWNLEWPTGKKVGPWGLSEAGIKQALGSNRFAIGVYWIGHSPQGSHSSFQAKYCGKAVLQPLFVRLNQHVKQSHNKAINDHLRSRNKELMPKLWFRFVEFATPQLSDVVEGVMIAAFREEYAWNRRNEWKQHWALEVA
jgi:hypothetical protein